MFACQTVEVDKQTENQQHSQSNTRSKTSHTHSGKRLNTDSPTELLDDHRALEPPDPIPNSVVKRRIADGSVGSPHVRVGHRQASTPNPRSS